MKLSQSSCLILLLLILALAGFFRFWQIDSVPPGLYPDEAMNANDALTTLETGQFKVFYPENNGREGLFIWLIALSFKIFGPAAWSLRLVSAIFGILTVLGLYLLTKELFTPHQARFGAGFNKNIALLSSFFLAISFWHINFSRIGFRAILVPFLLCFSFYFLLRAFRDQRLLNYLLAGLFFGLGFYTYIAFRMAVLILAVLILLNWKKFKKVNLLFFVIILIIALPIGIHFLNNPQDFMGRAGGVSIFSADQPLKELGLSTLKTLGMFNFAGDWNWRHNYAGSPMLIWSVGLLFVLGLILNLGNHRSRIFLLTWFVAMLLPAILTYEGLPHALRTIGVIPVVCIFAALGLAWLIDKLNKINQKIALLLLISFLICPCITNFNKYFFQWAKNEHVAGAFRKDLIDLTNYLINLPKTTQKIVVVNEPGVPVPYPDGITMPAQTIIFQSKINQSKINYLKTDHINQIKIDEQPTTIVLLKYDEAIFQQLTKKWPQGQIRQKNGFQMFVID